MFIFNIYYIKYIYVIMFIFNIYNIYIFFLEIIARFLAFYSKTLLSVIYSENTLKKYLAQPIKY